MRVAILVPFRPDGNRAHLWDFTRYWIGQNYNYPVTVADSSGEQFSAAEARNNAAKMAGDNWDVALFHDADTIAHPEAVNRALDIAVATDKMVVAADSHMYCDRLSTERIMASGVPMFPRPASFDQRGVYAKPCSGVIAVNRNTFDAVGGYVESLAGWGYEDLVFLQQCNLFAGGHDWIEGHINLHLWHEPARRDGNTRRNEHAWKMLANFRRLGNRAGARKYLADLGHRVP